MGRAYKIRKRSNHVTIVVATKSNLRRKFWVRRLIQSVLELVSSRGGNRTGENKSYAVKLVEDKKLRTYVRKRLQNAGISTIVIDRTSKILFSQFIHQDLVL